MPDGSDSPTVVCVLRGGGDFYASHVVHLYQSILSYWPAHLPLRFVALTDRQVNTPPIEERPLRHHWPTWWAKLELFSPEHADLGSILYFDLDTVMVGALDQVAAVQGHTVLRDFYRAKRLGSGMMLLPAAVRPPVWEAWMQGPEAAINCCPVGDQQFLFRHWLSTHTPVAYWQDVVPGQVISFKAHIRKRKLPRDARVVCFHGRPRPWEVQLPTRRSVVA